MSVRHSVSVAANFSLNLVGRYVVGGDLMQEEEEEEAVEGEEIFVLACCA